MSVVSSLARRSLLTGARLADAARPPRPGATVLIYHRVGGGSGSAIDLDVDEFRRQLDHLAATNRVIPLASAVDQPGTDGVVITFDDGTADFVDVVVPLLIEYRLPATLYVATAFVDEQSAFPWGAPPASWRALADASATGLVAIESHSHTHPSFALLDEAGATDEVRSASDLIGEHIGRVPQHFAYPRAIPPSSAADGAVRRLHRSAALAGGGRNSLGQDLHRLRRTPVRAGESIEVFIARAASGLRLEGAVRARLLRHRQRGIVT